MAAPARILCTGPEIDPSIMNNEWTNAAKASKQGLHEVAYVREDVFFYGHDHNTNLTSIRLCEIQEIDGKEYALIDKDRLPIFYVDGEPTAIDPVVFMLKIRKLNSEAAGRRRQSTRNKDFIQKTILELRVLDQSIQDDKLKSNIRRLVRDAADYIPQERRFICDWANERL